MTFSISQTSSRVLYKASQLLKPKALAPGDTIGVFTPSWPGNVILKEKYQHGLQELKRLGFQYVEGSLTARGTHEGYRSGSPQERAAEFMELIHAPKVRCLMATIGGSNSSSMIPYLDFAAIRKSQKIVCGYSDMTSLHLAIARYSGLSSFYGPAVAASFGEAPHVLPYSADSFLDLTGNKSSARRELHPPKSVSNQFIDATKPGWKNIQRQFTPNSPWKVLIPGKATGKVIAADLETLLTSAGTPHFPDLDQALLFIEEMDAPFHKEERNFRHLALTGALDRLAGLVISKPSSFNQEGAPFSYDELILETIGSRPYPVISNFDCGHTYPMITLAQGLSASIEATGSQVRVFLEESAVE